MPCHRYEHSLGLCDDTGGSPKLLGTQIVKRGAALTLQGGLHHQARDAVSRQTVEIVGQANVEIAIEKNVLIVQMAYMA